MATFYIVLHIITYANVVTEPVVWGIDPTASTEYSHGVDDNPPVFRLGSGAVVAPSTNPLTSLHKYRTSSSANRMFTSETLKYFTLAGAAITAVLIVTHMLPGHRGGSSGGNNRDYQYRVPPSWSPETESTYPFRAFMTDVSLWMHLTDLQPHQQCAAIVARLGGAARDMARMLTPQEIMHGGQLVAGGPQLDPVAYLLGSLHARFSSLEEESRMTTMTEFLAFARLPHEDINSMLARYETVRQRAAVEGQLAMPTEFCALQILRACNVAPQHLFQLFAAFQRSVT